MYASNDSATGAQEEQGNAYTLGVPEEDQDTPDAAPKDLNELNKLFAKNPKKVKARIMTDANNLVAHIQKELKNAKAYVKDLLATINQYSYTNSETIINAKNALEAAINALTSFEIKSLPELPGLMEQLFDIQLAIMYEFNSIKKRINNDVIGRVHAAVEGAANTVAQYSTVLASGFSTLATIGATKLEKNDRSFIEAIRNIKFYGVNPERELRKRIEQMEAQFKKDQNRTKEDATQLFRLIIDIVTNDIQQSLLLIDKAVQMQVGHPKLAEIKESLSGFQDIELKINGITTDAVKSWIKYIEYILKGKIEENLHNIDIEITKLRELIKSLQESANKFAQSINDSALKTALLKVATAKELELSFNWGFMAVMGGLLFLVIGTGLALGLIGYLFFGLPLLLAGGTVLAFVGFVGFPVVITSDPSK